MSKLFGPVIQQGYVVPDLTRGMQHWIARGVGPFLVIDDLWIDSQHYGATTRVHISASFACSGDQQIELIEPWDDTGPNIYSDFLKKNPEGGLQHLAVWSDDVDGQLEELKQAGIDYIVAQHHAGTHAYLDMPESPGVMIQLMPTHQRYLDLFRMAEDQADIWDGKTDSIRPVDWDG
ncbi:MAG: VOC family protein [Proteobacteria bacterium]|nr:VOC family protein [Pseudomonadota bacterium]